MAKTQQTPIGIIGCGNISETYLRMCSRFENLRVAACADLDMDRARAKAAAFPGVRALTVDELLADRDIRIVVNLTTPQAHASVALAALKAGKSVHNEKPLAIARDDARRILALARRKKLRVGCAPDTFLGGGLQTCRKLLDDGRIGRPVAATAFMMSHGPEHWHPDPEFVYKKGAGPMFDIGPYYLTALVALLGPVKRVTGATARTQARRPILSQPKFGQMMKVEVQTHVAGLMDFACGAVGTIIMSFDVWAHNLPCLEIYGTEGTLSVPDPNTFGGPVRIRMGRDEKWHDVPLSHPYTENWRGIGVADMAYGLRSGRPHRASGGLAYHVLDLMCTFEDASRRGRHVRVRSGVDRPAPLPTRLKEGRLDK